MKPTVLIYLFLLSTIFVRGQAFKSIFSADTTRWHIHECIPDGGANHIYYSFSDTTFDQKVYHRLFQNYGIDTVLVGYIHEDSAGRYWFRKWVQGQYKEAIFMDLNLIAGDSFPVISDFRYMRVDSAIVDSVYFEDSRKIIRIKYDHCSLEWSDQVRFIEGIGPTNGFYMTAYYEQPWPYSLVCKFDGENRVYQNSFSLIEDCKYEPVGIAKNNENDPFNIFPNPSSGNITVQAVTSQVNCKYLVHNVIGVLVDKGYILDQSFQLNVRDNGIYFISFTCKDITHTERILILNE